MHKKLIWRGTLGLWFQPMTTKIDQEWFKVQATVIQRLHGNFKAFD